MPGADEITRRLVASIASRHALGRPDGDLQADLSADRVRRAILAEMPRLTARHRKALAKMLTDGGQP